MNKLILLTICYQGMCLLRGHRDSYIEKTGKVGRSHIFNRGQFAADLEKARPKYHAHVDWRYTTGWPRPDRKGPPRGGWPLNPHMLTESGSLQPGPIKNR